MQVGDVVLYTLSAQDADAINSRRDDAAVYRAAHVTSNAPGLPGRTGHVEHAGNRTSAGEVYPAVVVRDWGPSCANLQVLLDGNDTYWATSRVEGSGEGRWQPRGGA